jgi:hypothetical protein
MALTSVFLAGRRSAQKAGGIPAGPIAAGHTAAPRGKGTLTSRSLPDHPLI